MVERYTPKPIEERNSNNLTFGKFVKDNGYLIAFPLAGALIGYIGGRLKLPGFSGKNFIQNGQDALFRKSEITAKHVVELEQGSAAYHMSNMLNWGIVGGIVSAFTGWKKNEQNRLDLFDVNESLQEAIAMVPDEAAIEKDNRILEKQIDHLREKRGETPMFKVNEAALIGRAKETASLEIS